MYKRDLLTIKTVVSRTVCSMLQCVSQYVLQYVLQCVAMSRHMCVLYRLQYVAVCVALL